jgi:hypothetical protein
MGLGLRRTGGRFPVEGVNPERAEARSVDMASSSGEQLAEGSKGLPPSSGTGSDHPFEAFYARELAGLINRADASATNDGHQTGRASPSYTRRAPSRRWSRQGSRFAPSRRREAGCAPWPPWRSATATGPCHTWTGPPRGRLAVVSVSVGTLTSLHEVAPDGTVSAPFGGGAGPIAWRPAGETSAPGAPRHTAGGVSGHPDRPPRERVGAEERVRANLSGHHSWTSCRPTDWCPRAARCATSTSPRCRHRRRSTSPPSPARGSTSSSTSGSAHPNLRRVGLAVT